MSKRKRKELTIRLATPDDFRGLLDMYLRFEPKAEFQGLPPPTEEKIEKWLSTLLRENNVNFVIEMPKEGIVGHAVLCRDGVDRAELAIFLHQNYRSQGLGEKLMEAVVGFACHCLHFKKIWLDVQALNYPAVALFRKMGFVEMRELETTASELIMDRQVNCPVCQQEKCPVFDKSVPLRIELSDKDGGRRAREKKSRGQTVRGRPLRIAWQETPEELFWLYQRELYQPQKSVRRQNRLHALWLLRQGQPVGEVSQRVGVPIRTIQRWISWYRTGGLAEVRRRGPGPQALRRESSLTPESVQPAEDHAAEGPLEKVWHVVEHVREKLEEALE